VFDRGQYDFVNAKVHGMRGRLYEGERLDALLHYPTLPDLVRAVLPQYDSQGTVRSVERELTRGLFDALAEIARATDGPVQGLVQKLVRRCDLENLKVVIKFWDGRRRGVEGLPSECEDFLVECRGVEAPPVDEMLATQTVAELIDAIPDRTWQNACREAARGDTPETSTFYLEAALDVTYLLSLWDCIEKLPRLDRAVARRIIGTEIDIANVLWARRLRATYGLSASEANELLCPRGHYLSDAHRRAVCEAAHDLAQMVAVMPLGDRRGLPQILVEREADADALLLSHLYRVANREFYRDVFGIGVIAGYYVAKKVELVNLVRVIEGYKYRLRPEEIQSLLIPVAM